MRDEYQRDRDDEFLVPRQEAFPDFDQYFKDMEAAFQLSAHHIDTDSPDRWFWFEPPISSSDVEDIEQSTPHRIPQSLRTFFTEGASEVRLSFSCKFSEEVRRQNPHLPVEFRAGEGVVLPAPLLSARSLKRYIAEAQDYASWSGISEDETEQAVWNRAIPIAMWNNSDFLALDPGIDVNDPPVVFLDHEGESYGIAGNLAGFLTAWRDVSFTNIHDLHSLSIACGDTDEGKQIRLLLSGAW